MRPSSPSIPIRSRPSPSSCEAAGPSTAGDLEISRCAGAITYLASGEPDRMAGERAVVGGDVRLARAVPFLDADRLAALTAVMPDGQPFLETDAAGRRAARQPIRRVRRAHRSRRFGFRTRRPRGRDPRRPKRAERGPHDQGARGDRVLNPLDAVTALLAAVGLATATVTGSWLAVHLRRSAAATERIAAALGVTATTLPDAVRAVEEFAEGTALLAGRYRAAVDAARAPTRPTGRLRAPRSPPSSSWSSRKPGTRSTPARALRTTSASWRQSAGGRRSPGRRAASPERRSRAASGTDRRRRLRRSPGAAGAPRRLCARGVRPGIASPRPSAFRPGCSG